MQLLGPLRPKRADMAMAFVLRAIENLGARGIFGAVLPASMLDGESARPLREFLSPDIELNLLARLGSQQIFADVIVDPALVVATKCSDDGRKFSPTTLVWADHEPRSSEMALRALRRTESPLPIGDITEDEHFSIYSANKATKTDDWAPRPYKAARLFAELASAPRVNKLFSVQQGTITGMNSALLLRDEDFRSLPKAEQNFFRPAIVNGSIRNGQLLSETWVFYPNSEHLPAIENEEMLEARLKTFYQGWLLPNRSALMRRARIKEECWWRLSEHRNWQVKPSVKIVSTYFGGAGSFALDRAGSFVVVQGYGWLPKTKAIQSDDRNALCLLAILNSPVTGDLLAGVSSNVAGGQWNLSKRFVERMPIIDPQLLAEDVRDTLASFGLAMCDGRPFEIHLLDRLVREVLSVHGRFS
jgi:adenine-specific DNA-methyltransferase